MLFCLSGAIGNWGQATEMVIFTVKSELDGDERKEVEWFERSEGVRLGKRKRRLELFGRLFQT